MATKPLNDEKKDLMNYQPSTDLAVRPDQLKAVRRLTMDATSIARLGQVILQTTSELYIIQLPVPGKGGEKADATVVDIVTIPDMRPFMLICNAMIGSSLRRAGEPLTGQYFAMRPGEIVAGKHYRHVDVISLELVK